MKTVVLVLVVLMFCGVCFADNLKVQNDKLVVTKRAFVADEVSAYTLNELEIKRAKLAQAIVDLDKEYNDYRPKLAAELAEVQEYLTTLEAALNN